MKAKKERFFVQKMQPDAEELFYANKNALSDRASIRQPLNNIDFAAAKKYSGVELIFFYMLRLGIC